MSTWTAPEDGLYRFPLIAPPPLDWLTRHLSPERVGTPLSPLGFFSFDGEIESTLNRYDRPRSWTPAVAALIERSGCSVEYAVSALDHVVAPEPPKARLIPAAWLGGPWGAADTLRAPFVPWERKP